VLAERLVIAVDPMLATGNTAVAAMDRLKEHGASELRFVCLLATETGLSNFHRHHPEVRVWTAAIDEQLNDHGYILPGLGDAGDRLYGTR
jgi:uracil phosphoribosyltransferase